MLNRINEIKGTLRDTGTAVAWIRDAYVAFTRTPAGSAERSAKLDDLTRKVQEIRAQADAAGGNLTPGIKVALTLAEQGIRSARGEDRNQGRYTR